MDLRYKVQHTNITSEGGKDLRVEVQLICIALRGGKYLFVEVQHIRIALRDNKKSKSLALKYVSQLYKSPKIWEPKEASHVGDSEEDSNDQEMAFIINCKNIRHFIVGCPQLQKDKSKKGSYQMDNFRKNIQEDSHGNMG